MRRRRFIRQSIGSAAGLTLLGIPSLANNNKKSDLTILHTNDMHSRIDPFPNDGGKYAGLGGIARRAALVRQIRSSEENVLLLDAGDIFQGTPYFNLFEGELEFKLMSQMEYDAATLGNHDFDNGLEGLHKQLPHASFPFIISNYDFSATSLVNRFLPYKIFQKQEITVGVFGLGIELKGLVVEKLYANTKYIDPIPVAKEMVQQLRALDCDLVICLSHLGYKYRRPKVSDQQLASEVAGIDLIIGGHTHTFLDQPESVIGPEGHLTLINQVGFGGINLGRIDYKLVADSGNLTPTSNTVKVSN
jgi:5'-nucleotidase